MNNTVALKIEDFIGHQVEAEVSISGYVGKVNRKLTGRIIYSGYNESLMFKPKHSRSKGYLIESENDIHSVNIIRRDNKNNRFYIEEYNKRDQYEMELNKRFEKEKTRREEQERLRKEQIELERKKKLEVEQRRIEEAKSLGGYEELEKEVISFYESFKDEFFNENFVKKTYIPILNKLINKGISNVNDYPRYYFDKKHNPKFCRLIEMKLNVKLKNTQKGNIEILNDYLAS